MMPWAHGPQIKAIATLVAAIIAKQRGCQAELARTQGNQEAATKRLSRLIHNARLNPKDFADCVSKGASRSIPSGVGSTACVLPATRGAVTSVAWPTGKASPVKAGAR